MNTESGTGLSRTLRVPKIELMTRKLDRRRVAVTVAVRPTTTTKSDISVKRMLRVTKLNVQMNCRHSNHIRFQLVRGATVAQPIAKLYIIKSES